MRVIKKLQRVGDYSYCLVVPKERLARNDNPREVEVRVERMRITIMPTPAKPREEAPSAEEG